MNVYSQVRAPVRPGPRRRAALLLAPALLAVAALGFALGHGRHVRVEATREATTGVGSFEYPAASGWEPAASAPTLPGLSISRPFVLAPAGDGERAGLLAGRLESGGGPLPSGLLAQLPRVPSTEVVFLLNTQAYKYSDVVMPGSAKTLTIYTIPNTTPSTTAIVCYSTGSAVSYMTACERMVSTFITLSTGSSEALDLTPSASYTHQIRSAVERLDSLRGELRAEIRPQVTRAKAQELSSRLGSGVSAIATALSAVQPPAPAGRAQAVLVRSLSSASRAYAGFAAAVGGGRTLDYAAARTHVYEAERRVNAALENLSLLGYN